MIEPPVFVVYELWDIERVHVLRSAGQAFRGAVEI